MEPAEYEQIVITYNGYLDRITNAVRNFCEDLTDSNYQEISGVLPALIDGITWVNEAMESFVKLNQISVERYQEFQQMIHSLHETLENKDNVLLYDLLQYDVIPLLEGIKIKEAEAN